MDELASALGSCLGGPYQKVVDQTGVQGEYQLAYDCPMNTPPQPALGAGTGDGMPPDPQDSGALARSLEALGLKLEKCKFTQDVYVVDHIQHPSEN